MMFQLGEGKLTNISQVTTILLSIFDLLWNSDSNDVPARKRQTRKHIVNISAIFFLFPVILFFCWCSLFLLHSNNGMCQLFVDKLLDACFSLNVYYFLFAETISFGFMCIKNTLPFVSCLFSGKDKSIIFFVCFSGMCLYAFCSLPRSW